MKYDLFVTELVILNVFFLALIFLNFQNKCQIVAILVLVQVESSGLVRFLHNTVQNKKTN